MAEILTTSAQLRSKAEELSNINAKFKQQVDQLESTETALVSMWEGGIPRRIQQRQGADAQLLQRDCAVCFGAQPDSDEL